MKKLLSKNNFENIVVHVIFNGKFNEKYECVGILVREEKDFVRVAFSAKDDKIKDYLDIKRSDVKNVNVLNPSDIEKLH